MKFADDTQMFISFSPGESLEKIEICTKDLELWFCRNGLCLNPSKSECILLGSNQRLKHLTPLKYLHVADSEIALSSSIKTLGVTIDSTLSFDKHINSVSKSCNFHIKALRHIRPALTLESAKTVACSIVQSRLDYANSILYGVSKSNLVKLQRIQNSLSRVVLGAGSSQMSSTHRLNTLHWLPIEFRIQFKLAFLTSKILRTEQPAYLHCLLHTHEPIRHLRSSNHNLLTIPRTKTKIGSRGFRYCAPKIWNNLPDNLRENTLSDNVFRSKLKTHFFQISPHNFLVTWLNPRASDSQEIVTLCA